ncbi:acyltransferase family protein [Nocardioides lianchengensis]|uniref:Peptidoglycan/LPS O-acetylase OafA/YrhL, contains acyltransferase and SGNH-hydrolase domains n=1 Tax=Nocardioides lianchengensis TaxID=1045774 RepID=A0A1G6L615_9ACTN|nr:acyltransferase [Nocardioides lianchengensis]NYG12671.1 peptidoglycan/LPS O-acetylase OafA/YrhL [Nocardioides lianchengensis]SDC38694.1 Peptidoglycan/LPS O-acetylase OafA/YrhL, contains acyltransferase and SGNH-hydrolase domains [Nocardioides lianchengensis]
MRIQGLDLLRGIAVGLVVLRHALPDLAPGAGVVGVVMFFALSGHLITGVLLGELQRTGQVDLRRFYVRRARRLVPALLLVVAGVALVTLLLDPLGDRSSLGKDVLVALTWTGNLPRLTPDGATFHLWTLATEEQFYLVWPALLALAFRRRLVLVLLVAATAVCLAACLVTVLWLHAEPDLAYALPTSWAVCFVIGAASRILSPRLAVPSWALGAALAGLALLSVIPLRGHALTYLVAGPAVALLTAVLLLAWRDWTDVTAPTLRPLVALGTISYGAYLWNYPLTLWLRPHGEYAGLLAAALTVPLALLSWHLVEKRFAPARTLVAA